MAKNHYQDRWRPHLLEQVGRDVRPFMHDTVARFLPVSLAGFNALDVGAGAGIESVWLAQQGCTVSAVDDSPTAIWLLTQAAAKVAMLAGAGSIKPVAKSLADLSPKDFSGVDLVLDMAGSSHLTRAEFRAFTNAMIKGLKPGGVYAASLVGDKSRWDGNALQGRALQNETSTRALLTGFDVLHFREVVINARYDDQAPSEPPARVDNLLEVVARRRDPKAVCD